MIRNLKKNRRNLRLVTIFVFLFSLIFLAGESAFARPPQIIMHLFYSSACSSCHEAMAEIAKVRKSHPWLKVQYHNIIYPENLKLKRAYSNYYRVPATDASGVPLAFLGNRYLPESKIRREYLIKLIDSSGHFASETPSEEKVLAAIRNDHSESGNIGIVTVITSGLIDGINPCAFVTLTFLISLLYIQKASRKRILIVGFFYTGAVFLTYLAAGLGLSSAIGALERFSWLLEILQLIMGVTALIFGLLSFRDFLAMRRGEFQEVTLKLPAPISGAIRMVLKKGSSAIFLPLGATAAGVIVSGLEFMCTGQVYLPTLIYMRTVSALRGQALFLLIAYNLAFIIPLLIVFLITLAGTSSFKIVKAGNRLYPMAKLALSIVFLILGFFLVDSVAKVLVRMLI